MTFLSSYLVHVWQESRRFSAFTCTPTLLRMAVGQCLLVVAQRDFAELGRPWQIWMYAGEIDWGQGKERRHCGQLLVPARLETDRPVSLSDTFCALNSRRRGASDLLPAHVVRAGDDESSPISVLDSRAPLYLIPEVNLESVWFPEPFRMTKQRSRGEFGFPQRVAKRIEMECPAVFKHVFSGPSGGRE